MEYEDFRAILRARVLHPQIDLTGSLQGGMAYLFKRMLIRPDNPDLAVPIIRFVYNKDPRVTKHTINRSFIGETLEEVITKIENTYPISFTLTPNLEGGFDLSFEYYERHFYFDPIEGCKAERRTYGCTYSKS